MQKAAALFHLESEIAGLPMNLHHVAVVSLFGGMPEWLFYPGSMPQLLNCKLHLRLMMMMSSQ